MIDRSIRVAFWNVENLFDPLRDVGRGPASGEELDAKLDAVTAVLSELFGGAGPDLLGLAEVGDGRLFDRVVAGLPGAYLRLWEPAVRRDHTGLGVAVRAAVCPDLEPVATYRPLVLARPRFVAVRIRPHGDPRSVLFVVNHWKSCRAVHGDPTADRLDRVRTGRELADILAADDTSDGAILIGDFNAEPFDPPFLAGGLRTGPWAGRVFPQPRRDPTSATPLYNTAWRFLAPPDLWEHASDSEYRESRPRGSHIDGRLFDQLLVTTRLLRGGPLRLRERTVEYAAGPTLSEHLRGGRLVPRRWRYTKPGDFAGASDHFPLTAAFAVTRAERTDA